MSSSNRQGGVCDARLIKADQQVGVMRLPLNRADDFVDQFNRKYGLIGLQLMQVPKSQPETEKIPASNEADEDFVN